MSTVRQNILSPEDWNEVRHLLDECLTLDVDSREQLLKRATAGKPWLRHEVESLLASAQATDVLLGAPMIHRMPVLGGAPLRSPNDESKFIAERVGRYLLFHRLGQGGMAEVFLAKMFGAHGFERLVAVKRILPSYASDPELRSLFEIEAQLSSKLTHANIVHVYDFLSHEGSCLLAMEFVNGKNLADVVRRAHELGITIPVAFSLYVVARVADGLDYAHRRREDATGRPLNIIHRDISPKNIMLSFEGEAKIVDFGIAKAQNRMSLTRSGVIRGTLGYLSPEAVSGKPIDARSDIFSASAVLYELLSGQRLFSGDDFFEVMGQIREGEVVRSRLASLALDAELRSVLSRGLSTSPESRFDSAGQLRDELDAYLARRFPSGARERVASFLGTLYRGEIEERRVVIERAPAYSETPVSKRTQAFLPSLEVAGVRREPHDPPGWRALSMLGAAIGILAYFFLGRGTPVPASRQTIAPPAQREPARSESPPATRAIQKPPLITVATKAEPSADSVAAVLPAHDPCAAEASQLCPGKVWTRGLSVCLKGVESQLSSACRQRLGDTPLLKICGTDAIRLCPGLQGRAIRPCLTGHGSAVSAGCRKFLDTRSGGP